MNMNTKIYEAIVELHNEGKNKGQIEGFLRYAHDLSVNQAKASIKEVFETEGWTAVGTSSADHTETITFLRENYGKMAKKDLINEMCEINGKTYKTNEHAYVYIPMMIEWSKQELKDQELEVAA